MVTSRKQLPLTTIFASYISSSAIAPSNIGRFHYSSKSWLWKWIQNLAEHQMELVVKIANSFLVINFLRRKIYLTCFTGFYVRLFDVIIVSGNFRGYHRLSSLRKLNHNTDFIWSAYSRIQSKYKDADQTKPFFWFILYSASKHIGNLQETFLFFTGDIDRLELLTNFLSLP